MVIIHSTFGRQFGYERKHQLVSSRCHKDALATQGPAVPAIRCRTLTGELGLLAKISLVRSSFHARFGYARGTTTSHTLEGLRELFLRLRPPSPSRFLDHFGANLCQAVMWQAHFNRMRRPKAGFRSLIFKVVRRAAVSFSRFDATSLHW
jgi:hypothetical protein